MANLPFAKPHITEAENLAVQQVIASGMLAGGQKVTEFENRMAEALGAKYAVAVGSCTQGFRLVLEQLRQPEIEAYGPVYTFTGPSMMARHMGIAFTGLDNAQDSFTPDYMQLLDTIPHGSILMPVHFAGLAVDIAEIVAARPDLRVVDDAAHVFRAERNGLVVGSMGATATVFSFYATKPLCTGNGGMILTDDESLATELCKMRLQGFSADLRQRYENPGMPWMYDVQLAGWKDNLTDMAAAMGVVQLDRGLAMQERRRQIAEMYYAGLKDAPGIILPWPGAGEHSWHLFALRVLSGRRNALFEHMAKAGVGTSVHFIPLHHHTAWRNYLTEGYPNTDEVFEQELSLPIYSYMSDEDVNRVIEAVLAFPEAA